MSLILFGPFYENKNDATITRQIMTEDIKSQSYGTDVFTVNLFFRDGLILLKSADYEAKQFLN